jgi:hypothetical protein
MNSKLERLNPVAAFGVFFCFVGVVWTIIELVRFVGLVSKLRPSSKLEVWPIFVPIYGQIYLGQMAKEINSFIAERGLKVQPATENVLLAFIFPIINYHSLFSTFNKAADASGN